MVWRLKLTLVRVVAARFVPSLVSLPPPKQLRALGDARIKQREKEHRAQEQHDRSTENSCDEVSVDRVSEYEPHESGNHNQTQSHLYALPRLTQQDPATHASTLEPKSCFAKS